MTPRQLLLFVILGLIWGSSFLLVELLIDDIEPLLLTSGRVLFGFIALALLVRIRRLPLPRGLAAYCWLFLMGTVGLAIPFFLLALGQERISSGSAAVLTSTVPLLTAIFSVWLLTDESLTPSKIVGVVVGFAGMLVLSGGDLIEIGGDALLGDAVVLAAAAMWAASTIVARRYLQQVHPLSLSAFQLGFALLSIAPVALVLAPPSGAQTLNAGQWAAWAALGFVSTGITYWGFYWLVNELGALKTTMINYIVPVVALFLGWLLLDESLGAIKVLGLVLIVAGVVLVNELGSSRRQRRAYPIPVAQPLPQRSAE